MKRFSTLSAALALSVFAAGAMAQAAAPAAKPAATKPATAKPAAKPAAKPVSKAAKAAPVAAAAAAVAMSPSQLETAKRVHTGACACEFDQQVNVDPIDGKPGMFKVAHKGQNYTMVPEDTTTGAVRLEDKKAGVMWLQIANKSMLMNTRAGSRMVDNCVHAAQKS
jgi:hypothetical protein